MKNDDILKLYHVICKVMKINTPDVEPDFSYYMAENKRVLKDIVVVIKEGVKQKVEFERKRKELCKKCANLDEKKRPIILPDGSYDIAEDKISELEAKGKELIESYKDSLKKADDILNKENENNLKFSEINLKLFPKGISGEDMEVLRPLIIIKEIKK